MLKPGDIVGSKVHPDWSLDTSQALRVLSDEEIKAHQEQIRTMETDKNEQKTVQKSQVAEFKDALFWKKINFNDGVHPETSEARIYRPAQFVMQMLDDPDNYRDLAWVRFDNNQVFWLYTYWNNTLPEGFFSDVIKLQGKKDSYKELLWLVQKETNAIFIENDTSDAIKSNEEFQITKIKKGMEELNQHKNDSEFNQKYNDWMYSILYLLHESFWQAYRKKYWDYYQTEDQKDALEKMKERAKNVKVS